MREQRKVTKSALALFVLGLVACGLLIGKSSGVASGQSGLKPAPEGLKVNYHSPIVIEEAKPDKDMHLQPGWKLFLVGTNQYDNLDAEFDLHYAVKDAQSLRARFIQLGVPEKDITILTSQSRGGLCSTKKNIDAAFEEFVANLKEGDTAFVYLS